MPFRRRYLRPGVRPLKPKTETYTTAPRHRFRLFQKLPPELQLMIWDFWREDRLEVRHFMFYFTEGLCYGAYDFQRRIFITEEIPVDPMRVKIDLRVSRYPVQKLNNWRQLGHALRGKAPRVAASSPFAWVDFKKDGFVTYDLLPEWWRPRYFAFDKCYSDWWRHVTHLNLCVRKELKPEFYNYLPDELCALKTLSILRVPPLRCKRNNFMFLIDQGLLQRGFQYPDSWDETLARDKILSSIRFEYQRPVKTAAEQIEHSFRMSGREIDIKIVWDTTRYETQ
ncbi:uncharacterized protein F4807DRAFT_469134 [Annulohypoxylon truncatum]|uniref:uncharacterized protein n=1 Tax=Annulohypoxylon truncatum TaxID=327061 RepID=UPI002007B49B|nr:uncharacterized protein F4807DRAFT_469134 [Annulohypoxylon truncatum]KAI1207615.1 hypothetical protein F4807DRAFT_469134 [Annulohypoxylon truncatum]